MTTPASRTFPALTLAGLTTGVTLRANFGELQEAAEYIVGYSAWTHEFSSQAFADRLRELILAQHPTLPTSVGDSWEQTRDAVLAQFPEPLAMPLGKEVRTEDPIASYARLRQSALRKVSS